LGVKRIILVTSNFHSRRSSLVFHLFLPRYHFWSVAAPDKVFDPASWWKTEQGRRIAASEYRKMAGTLLIRMGISRELLDWQSSESTNSSR
jgi:uncharacterized SAM-binding protein YcdF (DUF218 family)